MTTLSELHNAAYYASFTPPYETLSEIWNGHFGRAADQVKAQLHPESVIDAGCALGVLVRQFLARGIDARGLDFSEDAIALATAADPELVGRLMVHDLSQPVVVPGWVADVAISIEVLEHIPEEFAAQSVANLCAMARRYVVFSSSPSDEECSVHVNVQPQGYWDALFEAAGFRRGFQDVTNFCPWAAVYERVEPFEEPTPDEVESEDEAAADQDVHVWEESGEVLKAGGSVLETQEFPALQAVEPGAELPPEVTGDKPNPTTSKRKSAKK